MSKADSVRPSSELIDLSHSKAEVISLNRWKHVHRTHTKRVNDEATTSQSETAMEASPCSRVCLPSQLRTSTAMRRTTNRKKNWEEKGKITPSNAGLVGEVAFFPISAHYPSRRRHIQHFENTTESSFIFSSFLHPKYRRKNPSRNIGLCWAEIIFS